MKTNFKLCAVLLMFCCGLGQGQEIANGILEFRIEDEDKGELIPGKLVFLQNGMPAAFSASLPDHLVIRDNVIYSARGRGRIALSSGHYEIWAGHGIEYSVSKQHVTIDGNRERRQTFRLQRTVDTRGYIGTDLRLHPTSFSEQEANVVENLIICVAEGLELVAVTDPEQASQYKMLLSQLGLDALLQIRTATEIRTNLGHFSAYPLPPDFKDAFETVTDAGQLFQLLRSLPTDPVIQVNHPRDMNEGYFTKMDLDKDFAVSGQPDESLNFDVVEVLNQSPDADWYGTDSIPLQQDWYNLLNSGYRFTAVGNSGGHSLPDVVPGLPRNYLASSTDVPTDISDPELIASLRNKPRHFCRHGSPWRIPGGTPGICQERTRHL